MQRGGKGDEWCARGVWWYMGEGRVISGVWCLGRERVISGVWCVGGVRETSGRGGRTQLNFAK